jgi:negative regulator of sigma E activity
MSDSDTAGFGKYVPGYDFLQGLAKNASTSIPQMPNLANWVAPTLNVEELEKRIEELKNVHFWLEQNSRALGATIQALEVQKMTLATLKGMNFNIGDVANALKLKAADSVYTGVQRVTDKAATTAKTMTEVSPTLTTKSKSKTKVKDKMAGVAGLIDPLQLWGSLTQQFQQIASGAMREASAKTAVDATKNMADGLAKEAIKTATGIVPQVKPAKKTAARKTSAKKAPG